MNKKTKTKKVPSKKVTVKKTVKKTPKKVSKKKTCKSSGVTVKEIDHSIITVGDDQSRLELIKGLVVPS